MSTDTAQYKALPRTFGERLAMIRKEKGYTTAREFYDYMYKYWTRLDKSAPITYTTYSAYENNSRQPKLEVVAELARFLNTSLDILLDLYNEDYLLHYLHSHNYDAHSIGEHIVINMNGNYIGIQKNILLHILHKGHNKWSDFIEQYLNRVLSNTFRHFSDKNILAGNDLIGAAMANLLDVDFNEYKENMTHTTRALKVYFNENPVMALLFYYFTHTNPFENPQRTEDFLNMTYTYSTSEHPFNEDYLYQHYSEDLVDMFYYADTMIRIDFIDQYLLEILGMKKSEAYNLKTWFFLGLVGGFHMAEYSYNENDLSSAPTFYLSHLYSSMNDDDDLFITIDDESIFYEPSHNTSNNNHPHMRETRDSYTVQNIYAKEKL